MGNRVVGLGSLTVKDNLWQEGKIAYIEEIVVHEDLRGKGIGTQLLEQLVRSAKEAGCRRVELDSAFHRKEAHGFYERHGFENRAFLFSKVL
jgi:ribosomal protein S18 acetylase RimI-like enzyme